MNRRTPAWLTSARDSWLGDATRWITDTVEALGLGSPAGVTPIRERPWGAVVRVDMPDGVLFFKAEGEGAWQEPVVVADIASTHPQLVPELLATDLDRGWLLMSDHGSPMWDTVDAAGEIEIWARIFPMYAHMQRASTENIGRWIDAGTPDRRLPVLPGLLQQVLAGGDVPLDADKRRAIDSMLPNLESVCRELAATSFAQSIDHSDMHGGNVLIGRGDARLVDWGDACITHPFVSPFVTYQHAVAKLPASDRPAAALRLRDVYLEPWTEDASVHDLRDAFAKATWLGHVIRALNFVHQLHGVYEWGTDVAKFLGRWQEQHALLGRGDDLILAVADEIE